MPVVKLKKLVAVSSEDEVHVATNLVSPSVGLQWLCSRDNKAKRSEVTIELAKPSRIKQVEIGNVGSAFVELLVKSMLESSEGNEVGAGSEAEYQSLLPQSMLMSAEESRSGRSLTRTKLFPPDKLSKVALEKKWLFIKIVCLQPFCTSRQYGLRYIKLFSHSPLDEGALPTGTTTTPNRAHFSPLTINNHQLSRTPKISPILTPTRTPPTAQTTPTHIKSELKGKTVPLRRRIACKIGGNHDDDGDEFTGLESQSRLLKNTLKQDTSTIKSNSILSRIASERGHKDKDNEERAAGFTRKKLLVKELPKVESVNFVDSYKTTDSSKNANRFSSYKISCLDDSSEMGEEQQRKYKGKKTSKKRSKKGGATTDQWISRKSKKLDNNEDDCMIQIPGDFKNLPTQTPEQKSMNNYFQKHNKDSNIVYIDDNGTDPDISIVIDSTPDRHVSEPRTSDTGDGCVTRDGRVKCPICGEWVPSYIIEVHASECAESTFGESHQRHVDNDVILCG